MKMPRLITMKQRLRMKEDSHYDPLRPMLRIRATELRDAASRIERYLSSPAQCTEESTARMWFK